MIESNGSDEANNDSESDTGEITGISSAAVARTDTGNINRSMAANTKEFALK